MYYVTGRLPLRLCIQVPWKLTNTKSYSKSFQVSATQRILGSHKTQPLIPCGLNIISKAREVNKSQKSGLKSLGFDLEWFEWFSVTNLGDALQGVTTNERNVVGWQNVCAIGFYSYLRMWRCKIVRGIQNNEGDPQLLAGHLHELDLVLWREHYIERFLG